MLLQELHWSSGTLPLLLPLLQRYRQQLGHAILQAPLCLLPLVRCGSLLLSCGDARVKAEQPEAAAGAAAGHLPAEAGAAVPEAEPAAEPAPPPAPAPAQPSAALPVSASPISTPDPLHHLHQLLLLLEDCAPGALAHCPGALQLAVHVTNRHWMLHQARTGSNGIIIGSPAWDGTKACFGRLWGIAAFRHAALELFVAESGSSAVLLPLLHCLWHDSKGGAFVTSSVQQLAAAYTARQQAGDSSSATLLSRALSKALAQARPGQEVTACLQQLLRSCPGQGARCLRAAAKHLASRPCAKHNGAFCAAQFVAHSAAMQAGTGAAPEPSSGSRSVAELLLRGIHRGLTDPQAVKEAAGAAGLPGLCRALVQLLQLGCELTELLQVVLLLVKAGAQEELVEAGCHVALLPRLQVGGGPRGTRCWVACATGYLQE